MKLEAKYSREWLNRMGIILLLFIGSSGWFFYDGLITYPRYNEGAAAYVEIARMVEEEGLSGETAEAEVAKRWAKVAADFKGDPAEPPTHFKNVDQQLHFGTGLGVLAVLFLIWILREMKRVIRADDETFEGITKVLPMIYSKKTVPYDAVVGLDKRKWDNKGIAVIHCKNADGSKFRVIVDDYKYAGSEGILEKCETVVAAKKAAKFGATGTSPLTVDTKEVDSAVDKILAEKAEGSAPHNVSADSQEIGNAAEKILAGTNSDAGTPKNS